MKTTEDMSRRELFQACANAPDDHAVTLRIYDGEVQPVAVAIDGAIVVQISKGFYLQMDAEIGNRLVLTIAKAICDIDAEAQKAGEP